MKVSSRFQTNKKKLTICLFLTFKTTHNFYLQSSHKLNFDWGLRKKKNVFVIINPHVSLQKVDQWLILELWGGVSNGDVCSQFCRLVKAVDNKKLRFKRRPIKVECLIKQIGKMFLFPVEMWEGRRLAGSSHDAFPGHRLLFLALPPSSHSFHLSISLLWLHHNSLKGAGPAHPFLQKTPPEN